MKFLMSALLLGAACGVLRCTPDDEAKDDGCDNFDLDTFDACREACDVYVNDLESCTTGEGWDEESCREVCVNGVDVDYSLLEVRCAVCVDTCSDFDECGVVISEDNF
jgi:hypothetical protein